MKYRMLSSTGDYVFGGGMSAYLEGDEAVAQAIKTKILLFYYEWWEDLGMGIPMFQSILGQTNPETIKTSLTELLEKRILEIDEVTGLKNIDIDYDRKQRSFSITLEATITNNTTVEVEVGF